MNGPDYEALEARWNLWWLDPAIARSYKHYKDWLGNTLIEYKDLLPYDYRSRPLFGDGKKAYISGPVTGIPELNTPAFLRLQELLRNLGFDVFNPRVLPDLAPLCGDDDELVWREYMKYCVAMLPSCDLIYMLPDWEKSRGACWEQRIAYMLGLEIRYAPNPGR